MKLYEIATNLRSLQELENEDLSYDDFIRITDELEKANASMAEKIDNISSVIKNLDHHREGLKKAEEEFNNRKKRVENTITYLESYLLNNMKMCNIDKISCNRFDVSVRKNPHSVIIKDESIIPNEYWIEKTERSLDKVKIKEELKSGVYIEGAELKQTERVVIK